MNNFGILEKLMESYSNDIAFNNKLVVALIIFISLNLITTIINLISQHNLKLKEKKIISFKIKEEKRTVIYEIIYKNLDKMTFYIGKNDSNDFLNSIQETERYISRNKLYIDKSCQQLINEILDYFKTVLADYRKKDYSIEMKLFEKLSSNFNK